jgi:hypothetical protein
MIRAVLAPKTASIPRVGDFYIQVDYSRMADHPVHYRQARHFNE